MFQLVEDKKKNMDLLQHDYVFKDFETFYEQMRLLTVPIFGRFNIGIISKSSEDIIKFIKSADSYNEFNITIYCSKAVLDYVMLRCVSVKTKENISPFELFIEQIAKRNLVIGNKEAGLLYNSIGHELYEMEEALDLIKEEYGEFVEITEKMLSKLFVLNKTQYPRSVLIDYIMLGRWRKYKLQKAIDAMGSEIVLGSMIKNLNVFMKQKATYYKTGQGSKLIKMLDTKNMLRLYRVLVSERHGLNDVTVLLELYERGLSSHDIVQRN